MERKEGPWTVRGRSVTVVDLPGTYSLVVSLSGYEPRSINGVELAPDEVLDVGLVVLPIARGVAAGSVFQPRSESRNYGAVLSLQRDW